MKPPEAGIYIDDEPDRPKQRYLKVVVFEYTETQAVVTGTGYLTDNDLKLLTEAVRMSRERSQIFTLRTDEA